VIGNYTQLQAAVASWLHRKDLTAQIPDFIALAESRMNAEIRSRELEVIYPATASGGNATINLPSNMVEMRRIRITSDPVRVLKYATPDQLAADYGNAASGQPSSFTVIGSTIQFGPVPDVNYPLEIIYQQRIEPLANTATNWILTKYPDAYLYGALLAAQPYVQDDARASGYEAMYQKAITNINSVDWYSGSTLRVRAC
jgi:hypothetical protein